MNDVDFEGLPPVCDEALFRAVGDFLAEQGAPRLFAVVQEHGERVNGRVVAYGMAFEDRVMMSANGEKFLFTLASIENAVRFYHHEDHGLRARVVWLNMLDHAQEESERTHTLEAVQIAA
ncbi:hypothetical protein [Saccharothrix xinjiangensis]|uniref:Uncharacterized protein n=1 Tax=Saccharothrix xinjiangensis TaxID=204798 RepID=A0ABV9Y2K6_9PSEU